MACIIFQKNINPPVGGNTEIVLCRLENYDPTKIESLLAVYGWKTEVPITPSEFEEPVTALNGAKYDLGVAELTEEFLGDNTMAVDSDAITYSGDKWKRTVQYGDQPPLPRDFTAQIKAEAERRIFLFAPLWKQQNIQRRMLDLFYKGMDNWTTEEQAEVARIKLGNDLIDAIRAASDALEATTPQPADFTNDKYWPDPLPPA